jgi:OFA family oxalate/formate antiporter-like MFS transporter
MSAQTDALPAPGPNRWFQLIVGIVCMTMIANLQYGWTYFVDPMDRQQHFGREAISFAFSIFVFTETWLVWIEGWFVDRYGPRVVVTVGGALVALGWGIYSAAQSLPMLYIGSVVSGIGAGAVYGTSVGNALKWFPDRRGLCAGLTAAGFGAGTALSVVPIINTIAAYGYQTAFLGFGLGQGAIILVLAQALRAPLPGQTPKPAAGLNQSRRDYTPAQMLRTPTFYVLYAMFVVVATPGLIVTADLALIAKDLDVATLSVAFLFANSTVLKTAGVVDNILNGLARPTFGWVSDRIGRESTMAIVFTAGAASYLCLDRFGDQPTAFILAAGLIFFTWGEIYSLFPATCTDCFGVKYAATNAGLLYSAKGTASLFVPLAILVKNMAGTWHPVFLIAVGLNLAVACAAMLVLRPMRARQMAGGALPAAAE